MSAMETIAGLSPGMAGLALLVALVAGAVGAVAGMGSGLLVTAFITPIIGAKAVVPVISAMMLVTNAGRVWAYRGDLVGSRIWLITGIAIPASALGAALYVRLDGELVQILLGLVLMLSIPLRRWMDRKQVTPTRIHVVAVSGTFGFLSSMIVGAGILVIPMLLGLGLTGPALIATDAAIAVIVNIAKVAFFGALDAMPRDLLFLALLLGFASIPGTWAGAWIVRRTSVRVHTFVIEALIFLGGLSLVAGAILN